jgi:hypothetical protein
VTVTNEGINHNAPELREPVKKNGEITDLFELI